MRIRRKGEAVKVLNITPLIDVVFILLVFFMMATNFAEYKLIRVETPRETEVVKTSEGAIVVQIAPGGELSFDNAPMERDSLTENVARVVQIDPERVFLVRPLDDVSLQEAVAIYDLVRRGGASTVSFSPPSQAGGDG